MYHLNGPINVVVFLQLNEPSYVPNEVDIHLPLNNIVHDGEEVDQVESKEPKEREKQQKYLSTITDSAEVIHQIRLSSS